MAIDYDAIRRENIRKYGEETRHLEFLGTLYSDRTHFLFELLQNAEDADASEVFFSLYEDHLEFYHDGRPFDEEDVWGICGVAEGTKAADLTKIGKFGIGFKSVYAYTESPVIHSGPEHFQIKHFVRPFRYASAEVPEKWTTRFDFPFNRRDVPAEEACQEIGEFLRKYLSMRTLLFLRNIESIAWSDEEANEGCLSRTTEEYGEGDRISLEDTDLGEDDAEEWLVFSRPVSDRDGTSSGVQVQVAFQLVQDDETEEEVVVPADGTELVVFFPTEKESHLGFLVQGPFRTTPARDNIPKHDRWNMRLMDQVAKLTVSSLHNLKKMDLLSVSALQTLPLDPSDFGEDSMFRPIYDAVRQELTARNLLPAEAGGYVSAEHGKIARGVELIRLFDETLLREIVGDSEARWISTDVTETQTPDLYHYLVGRPYRWQSSAISPLVPEMEVTPESLIRQLTADFLKDQDDDWMEHLYSYLSSHRGLWNSLKAVPIIRLANGRQVTACNRDGMPNAYLSNDPGCGFPIVLPRLTADYMVRHMLESMGLREPDLAEAILRRIVPKYKTEPVTVPETKNLRHVKRICAALGSVTRDKKELLVEELCDLPFLMGVNACTGDQAYCSPRSLYVRSADLELYFRNNSRAWFIDDRYDQCLDDLVQLGLDQDVYIDAANPDWFGRVRVADSHGYHVRGVDRFDPRCEVHGLEVALQDPDFDRSEFVWNRLLPRMTHLIRGVVETSTRQDFSHASSEVQSSVAGKFLMWHAWIPDSQGGFHRPCDISLDELPDGFLRSLVLSEQLGMKTTLISQFAREVEFDAEDIETLLEHKDEIRDFLKKLRKDQALPPKQLGDFREELGRLLGDDGASTQAGEESDDDDGPSTRRGRVRDPERRRAGIDSEIQSDIASIDPERARFKRVPERKWEGKNRVARTFLQEQYHGRCQICNDGFLKRDGKPYFEGLYLVSRTKAQWLDRPGNILCLCPTCCAKVLHGPVGGQDLGAQVDRYQGSGDEDPVLQVRLCGQEVQIRFTESHWIELERLLEVGRGDGNS